MRSTVDKRDSNDFVSSARCHSYTDSTAACIVTRVFTELEIRQFDSAFVKSSLVLSTSPLDFMVIRGSMSQR
jgi:hypothetical protein